MCAIIGSHPEDSFLPNSGFGVTAELPQKGKNGRQHIHNAAIHFKTIELLGQVTKADMLI